MPNVTINNLGSTGTHFCTKDSVLLKWRNTNNPGRAMPSKYGYSKQGCKKNNFAGNKRFWLHAVWCELLFSLRLPSMVGNNTHLYETKRVGMVPYHTKPPYQQCWLSQLVWIKKCWGSQLVLGLILVFCYFCEQFKCDPHTCKQYHRPDDWYLILNHITFLLVKHTILSFHPP